MLGGRRAEKHSCSLHGSQEAEAQSGKDKIFSLKSHHSDSPPPIRPHLPVPSISQ